MTELKVYLFVFFLLYAFSDCYFFDEYSVFELDSSYAQSYAHSCYWKKFYVIYVLMVLTSCWS